MFIFAEWSHKLHSMGLVHIIGIVSAILFGIAGGILAKKTKKHRSRQKPVFDVLHDTSEYIKVMNRRNDENK